MKYLVKGMNCIECVEDLQKHKKDISGLIKVDSYGEDILIEINNNISGEDILNKIKKHLEHMTHNHENLKIYENEFVFLEGLTCANCSAKIEEETKKLKGVEDANFSFSTEKYVLTFDESTNLEEIIKDVKLIVDRLEPGVKVTKSKKIDNKVNIDEDSKENESSGIKKDIIRFVGVFLVLIGLKVFNVDSKIATGLYLIAYLTVGYEVLLSAGKNILRGDFLDEQFLMSIASIGAIVVGQFPEAVAVMLFYSIGEMFEDLALEKSRKSISAALELKPDFANLLKDEELMMVSPEEVKVGDIIVIKPGEKIPLDGIVIEGESFVDTSNVTGESVPRKTSTGDKAISGCVNTSGMLKVKVESAYNDGTIAKILDLVENASSRKAPVEKFITKFSKIYTPVVVGLAVLMVVALPLTGLLTFKEALFRACTFLVISCPCALVISVPLGVFSGIGAASKTGIFVKGGNYLEALSEVIDVVFDKTGTITKGVFEVTEIYPVNGYSKEDIIKLAAYGEYNSTHPIGKAILNKYDKDININEIKDFNEISGHGLSYKLNGDSILVGNKKLLDKESIKIEEKSNKVATKVYVAKNGKFVGEIFVSDVLKDNIKEDLNKLKKKSINLTMLSGDSESIAKEMALEVGIDNAYGNLLPQGKVEKLEEIIDKSKGKVIFVGDGVNDSPVIARADIGIAMGAIGSDSAIEAADIVLMTDEIGKISDAIEISTHTKNIVYFNIAFALAVKIIVLILGALGYATMWAAVFADVGVTILAILNSMRVLNIKID